jgi:hypothetical protein
MPISKAEFFKSIEKFPWTVTSLEAAPKIFKDLQTDGIPGSLGIVVFFCGGPKLAKRLKAVQINPLPDSN